MYALDDTIAAIATAPGEAGLAVVRVSGPGASSILASVFRARLTQRPRRLVHGRVVEPASGELIDEAMAVFLPAPGTYTREPIAEIHCHGGGVAPRRVLAACLAAGARAAEPGEMTLRAFLNGRVDLAQAESVLDLVHARTDAQARLALRGVGGALAARVRPLRQRTLDLLAEVTASIDFPEDDVPEPALDDRLQRLAHDLEALRATAQQGALWRAGARVAIVGRPNVGKSSLLNALLGAERAIVTPTPGTTRDTIEETVSVDGFPLTLVDTAGLRETADQVEQLGVERAKAAAVSADLLLIVLDASEPLASADLDVLALTATRPCVIALNKSDLPLRLDTGALPTAPAVPVSALAPAHGGAGLDALRQELAEVSGARPVAADEALPANARHEHAIAEARDAVTSASQSRHADARAASLSVAVEHLGQITGESVTDDLLHTIFSRFCIGK